MKITVIIPVYNGGETLFEVLRGFERQTLGREQFEVLAVDDCSTDFSWERLQAWKTESQLPLRLVQQPQNLGVSSTRNLGAEQAQAELLLFVDQDCLPAPDLLEKHLAAHARFPGQQVAVAGKIIWSSEFSGSEAVEFYKQLYFPVWEGVNWNNAPFYYFITSNASVSKKGLLAAGLFDAEFRHLYDDVIGGWRLQQQGYKVVLEEAAVVYHHRELGLNEAIMRYRRMGNEMARMVRKYPDLVGILTEPGEVLVDSQVKQTLYRLLAQYATAQGLTEGFGREFPDKTLLELLEQAALLKNFETWRERRSELYISEIAALRQDKAQQLRYVQHLERAYQRQLDAVEALRRQQLDLADYAARLEQEQGYTKLGFNFSVLAHNLLNFNGIWRRIRTRLGQILEK